MGIFKKNFEMVQAHNSRNDVSYKQKVNRMSDWTEDEFKSMLGYKAPKNKETKVGSFIIFNTTDLKESIDWRQSNWVTKVKD